METPNAFVRLDSTVRDRLREFCEAKGLVMGRFVSNIITAHLDAEKAPRPAQSKKRRRPLPVKMRRKIQELRKNKHKAAKPAKKARRRRAAPKQRDIAAAPTISKLPAEGVE